MNVKIKLAIVALGLWTGGAAYITEAMRPGPPPQTVKALLARAADIYKLDPELLSAVAWQESKHDPSAVSKAGAVGVLQIMPAVAADAGGIDRANPVANIMTGAELLSRLLKRYGGNTGLALAAYNAGPARVDRWLKAGGKLDALPAETRGYVKAITGVGLEYWRKA